MFRLGNRLLLGFSEYTLKTTFSKPVKTTTKIQLAYILTIIKESNML